MKFYRAAPLNTIPAGQGDPVEPGGAVIAIRLADLVSPARRRSRPHGAGGGWHPADPRRGAAGVREGGRGRAAVVRRDGKAQAGGIRLITPGWAPWNSSSMSWPVPG